MNVIETTGLTKYYGKSRGVVDVDLAVPQGEIFGFIGPNGAGKSTTIRLLLNFIFPSRGSARVLGRDVVKESPAIKAEVGYIPGEVDYYDDMTAEELFAYSGRFYKKDCSLRTRQLVEMFELDTKKKFHSLSLGNKKKVAIIQALQHQPRLLVLDEPTGGLDPLMQRRFFELLREENKQGVTVFFSSHILSEVQRLCHRVAIIREGSVLKVEHMDDLRQTQFRNVRISFAGQAPRLDLPGILNSHVDNNTMQMFFSGDINELVAKLAGYELNGLWVEEPSLEDVFMHYYEEEGGQ